MRKAKLLAKRPPIPTYREQMIAEYGAGSRPCMDAAHHWLQCPYPGTPATCPATDTACINARPKRAYISVQSFEAAIRDVADKEPLPEPEPRPKQTQEERQRLHHAIIARRPGEMSRPQSPSDDELRRLYVEEQHSLTSLMSHYGVNFYQIKSWLARAGIPLRKQTVNPAQKRAPAASIKTSAFIQRSREQHADLLQEAQ